MKKILIVMCVTMIALPAMADLINPRISQENRAQIQEKRRQDYAKRQRNKTIKRVCGQHDNLDKKECKAKLKKEFQATLKYLEKEYQVESKPE